MVLELKWNIFVDLDGGHWVQSCHQAPTGGAPLLATREEAFEILGPYLDAIRSVIDKAIGRWLSLPADFRSDANALARATAINSLMHTHALSELPQLGIRVTSKRSYFLFRFGDRMELRFKKLDSKLRASYSRTKSALGFFEQQQLKQLQFEYPDAPPPITNAVAGYRWDDLTETKVKIYIVCPNGDNNAWDICISQETIDLAMGAAGAVVEPIRVSSRRTPAAKGDKTGRKSRSGPRPKERPSDQKNAGDE